MILSVDKLDVRSRGCCKPVLSDHCSLVLLENLELWLCNKEAVVCDIGPGELCGFNTGTFTLKPSGRVLMLPLNSSFLVGQAARGHIPPRASRL